MVLRALVVQSILDLQHVTGEVVDDTHDASIEVLRSVVDTAQVRTGKNAMIVAGDGLVEASPVLRQ